MAAAAVAGIGLARAAAPQSASISDAMFSLKLNIEFTGRKTDSQMVVQDGLLSSFQSYDYYSIEYS